MLGVIGLAIGSAFSTALAFGAIGLFVPGTGTPNANIVTDYLSNARDRYTQNTPCNSEANCPTVLENSADPSLLGINYPASFFPLVIFPGWCRSGPDGCDKWNDSVGKGTQKLDDELAPYLDSKSTEQVTLFGYSQGGAVVADELQRIAARNLDPSVLARLHVVTIGGIENPDGGLWQRLGFLPTIPFLDISFNPAMKTDNGFDTTAIGFEYDPVTYAPRYWGNPLALLNAVAALETVHGYYLAPNGNGPTDTLPYGYTAGPTGTLATQLDCKQSPANCRYGSSGETTYIMIPATSLPIFDFITGQVPAPLKPFVKPFVDLLTPVTKVLIDLGYDWSGNPDTPTPLSILPFNPFQNWLAVGANLIGASIQGVQAFVGDLGKLGSSATMLTPNTVPVNQIEPKQPFSRLASGTVQGDSAATVANNDQQHAVVEGLVHVNAVGDGTVAQNEIDQNKIDPNQGNKSEIAAANKADAANEADAANKADAAAKAATEKADANSKAAAEAADKAAAAAKAEADAKVAADLAKKDAAEKTANAAADAARQEAADKAKAANGSGASKPDDPKGATADTTTTTPAAADHQAAA